MCGKLRNLRASQTFRALTFAFLLLGPASFAPALSAHSPTISNPASPAPHSPAVPVSPVAPLLGSTQIQTKDAATIAAKYKTRAAAAGPDYLTGAVAGAANWEPHTLASAATYNAAVTAAAAQNRFAKGVQGSTAKLQKNLQAVGQSRYVAGVTNASDAYAQGMAPVISTLNSISLPPRGVKGTNQERANIVATRLRAMKVGAGQ